MPIDNKDNLKPVKAGDPISATGFNNIIEVVKRQDLGPGSYSGGAFTTRRRLDGGEGNAVDEKVLADDDDQTPGNLDKKIEDVGGTYDPLVHNIVYAETVDHTNPDTGLPDNKKRLYTLAGSDSSIPARAFVFTALKLSTDNTATVKWLDGSWVSTGSDITIYDSGKRFAGRIGWTGIANFINSKWEIVIAEGFARTIKAQLFQKSAYPSAGWGWAAKFKAITDSQDYGGGTITHNRYERIWPVALVDDEITYLNDDDIYIPQGVADADVPHTSGGHVDGPYVLMTLADPDADPPGYAVITPGTGMSIVRGNASGAVYDTDTTFTLGTLVLVQGKLPSTSTITVNNIYHLNYPSGANILAVHRADGSWENVPGDNFKVRINSTDASPGDLLDKIANPDTYDASVDQLVRCADNGDNTVQLFTAKGTGGGGSGLAPACGLSIITVSMVDYLQVYRADLIGPGLAAYDIHCGISVDLTDLGDTYTGPPMLFGNSGNVFLWKTVSDWLATLTGYSSSGEYALVTIDGVAQWVQTSPSCCGGA